MVGIESIGTYLPERRIRNSEKYDKFEIDESFLIKKIGVKERAVADENQMSSDLCVEAVKDLKKQTNIDINKIDVLIVVTQNPDYGLPHTSAIVHKKLEMSKSCACFDISLGCSGYVYSLSVIINFMNGNGMKNGLLLTADPYSKVIDENDKNTSLIFGDGATATLISETPRFECGKFTFGTNGELFESLIVKNRVLSMNGRSIYNFAASEIPVDLEKNIKLNNINKEEIDEYIFHPGSKYIIDTLTRKTKVDPEKVNFDIEGYGNTISSSIPMLLKKSINSKSNTIFITGFGVGLSWASTILRRIM